MRHQPFTILLHIALALILVGAFVTHFFGIQGTLSLRAGMPPISRFVKESGPGNGEFPFEVSLKDVEIIYYPATTTPMDFRSVIEIGDRLIPVAMNKVGEFDGWRFYQSGISPESSVFSISHDPWGTGITYFGYLLLGIGLIGFFFQKNTPWRSLLRKYRKGAVLLMFLLVVSPVKAETEPIRTDIKLSVMQRPLASNFGKVLVYWNDRICPVQTLARDVTLSLYGKESYKGFTPEQILSGWLFYYDEWCRDYLQSHPELKNVPLYPVTKADKKLAEKLSLIEWIGTGEIFRIYPYKTLDGPIEWLSLTGRRPSGMSVEQWTFMHTTIQDIKQQLLKGKNVKANELLTKLMAGQRKYALGATLPSETKINAERIYNVYVRPALAGILAICIGLVTLIRSLFNQKSNEIGIKPDKSVQTSGSSENYVFSQKDNDIPYKSIRWISLAIAVILLLYVTSAMGMLWWISGHVPLSNGPETMMFMALASFTGACLFRNLTLRGGLLIVGAMSLFVTSMGGRTPQIGAMMPVLSSPLLSIHVMVVMISYALFFLIAILSAVALLSRSQEQKRRFSILNRLMLTPAVALLGAGIFIGAIWANQTWGRYWGWDPKETCALVMWLVYALPVHWGSRYLAFFRKDKVLHIYLLLAILTVIFTYFGANYLLSGLHSYA